MTAPSDSSRIRRIGYALASAGLLLALMSPARASLVRPVNLEELARSAAKIVHGRCVDVAVETDPSLGQAVTRVTIAVTRQVKGRDGRRLTFRVLGDREERADEPRSEDGVPRFRRGEELILFLYGESRSGLTSPVGFGQGKFAVRTDKRDRRLAVNARSNEGLLRNLSPGAEERVRSRVPPGRVAGRDITVADLLDAVRAILEE